MRRALAALTILGAGLIAVACGGDEAVDDSDDSTAGDGDGDGDTNVDDELKSLQDQIDALKQLLEDTTNADAIASLEEQIKELQVAIDELTAPGCGKGGDCVGLPAATRALEPVIAAACAHLEGCCTPSLMKFGLGANITDAEECTQVLTDRYTRDLPIALQSVYPHQIFLELPSGFELPPLASIATSLELGRIELDQDAIDACIDVLEELDCTEAETPSCGESVETLCYGGNFFTGILSEGALCSTYSINECEEGLFCYGPPGGSVCRKDSGIGGPCVNGTGCSEGYCDRRTDTCVEYAEEGEACSFEDPHGLKYPNVPVELCDADLRCSLSTGTCISNCGDSIGRDCNWDWNCAAGAYCDTSKTPAPGYADGIHRSGTCSEKVGIGEDCTASNQCESGVCDVEGTEVCLAAPDLCSDDSDCESDEFCYSGGECRTTKFEEDDPCEADSWCADGLCTNGYCDGVGITGDHCFSGETLEEMLDGSRACPETDYCSYQTEHCTPKLALGDNCGGLSVIEVDVACGSENYCDALGECAVRLTNGEDCDAFSASFVPPELQRYYDPCRAGSYCKVTDTQVSFAGTCATQVAYAGLCDVSQPPSLQQCKGDNSCVDWNGLSRCEPDYGSDENFCPVQIYLNSEW